MKIDRLIGIIMLLANRGRMSAGAIAARYEVSVKTIQRDMEAINRAGVPIVAYQGKDGGYEIARSYRVDRSVLTGEQSAWIAQLLDGLSENFPLREFVELREKFAVLKQPEAHPNISFDFSAWGPDNASGQKLQAIETAFAKRRTLRFRYRNLRGECRTRRVEPLRLILKGMRWYMLGWCLTKEDSRLFKVQRMRDIALDAPFAAHRETDMAAVSAAWRRTAEVIRFRVTATFKDRLEEYFDAYTLDGDVAEIFWPVDEWAAGFFLGFGAAVEVLEPPRLREEIGKKIAALARLYFKQDMQMSGLIRYDDHGKAESESGDLNMETQNMEMQQFCQSCGMPLAEEAMYGTDAAGGKNAEYCRYCYKDGAFTASVTMEEMARLCAPHMADAAKGLTEAEAEQRMLDFFPALKRWRTDAVREVVCARAAYIALDGQGAPECGAAYAASLRVLYGVFAALQQIVGRRGQALPFSPPHTLWHLAEGGDFSHTPRAEWLWRNMLALPLFVSQEDLAEAKRALAADEPSAREVCLREMREGKCLQILHCGPYETLCAAVARLDEAVKESGGRLSGWHHDIYCNDPRVTPPAALMTLVRFPVAD